MTRTIVTERGTLWVCDNCGVLHPSQVVNGECEDCLTYTLDRTMRECSRGHAHCWQH